MRVDVNCVTSLDSITTTTTTTTTALKRKREEDEEEEEDDDRQLVQDTTKRHLVVDSRLARTLFRTRGVRPQPELHTSRMRVDFPLPLCSLTLWPIQPEVLRATPFLHLHHPHPPPHPETGQSTKGPYYFQYVPELWALSA